MSKVSFEAARKRRRRLKNQRFFANGAEEKKKKIEAHMQEISRLAVSCNLSLQDITEMFSLMWDEE